MPFGVTKGFANFHNDFTSPHLLGKTRLEVWAKNWIDMIEALPAKYDSEKNEKTEGLPLGAYDQLQYLYEIMQQMQNSKQEKEKLEEQIRIVRRIDELFEICTRYFVLTSLYFNKIGQSF